MYAIWPRIFFIGGATPRPPRRNEATPFRTLSRPCLCFLTPTQYLRRFAAAARLLLLLLQRDWEVGSPIHSNRSGDRGARRYVALAVRKESAAPRRINAFALSRAGVCKWKPADRRNRYKPIWTRRPRRPGIFRFVYGRHTRRRRRRGGAI